jgi:predicted secreted protein
MGISAYGTLLKIGDGAGPEVFTTVAEVKTIGGPNIKVDTVDLTTHSSSGAWRQFLATLIDPGELSIDVNFLPTNATQSQSTGLLKDLKNRTLRNWQLVFPDGSSTTWTFAAYVTGFAISAPVDDLLGASVTLRLSGQPTLTG